MKLRNYKKIENLEREVDDLKNRLKKAEKLLKNEGANLNPTFPFNFSSPIFYSSMLPLVPSSDSLSLGTNNCLNVQPSQMFVPETRQIFSTDFSKETLTLNVPNNNDLATNLIGNFQPENDKCKKETQREKEVENMQNIKESEKNSEMGDFAIENQENINPDLKTEKISSLSLTPVPLPRKAKQLRKTEVSNENKTSAESPRIMEITSETGEKNFNCKSISCSSLTREERKEENFCLTERNLTKGMNNSMGNLKAKEKTSKGNKTGSFIQKILVSSSPSLLELKKNFMKSFNNLYDSVSVSARESTKSKKNIFRSNKGDFPDTHSNVKPCFALKETKKPNVKEIKHETKGKVK